MKEWLIRGLCVFLALTAGYYYVALKQSGVALQILQAQVQQQSDVLNNHCRIVLERQGFEVTSTLPPPEEEPEVKDDAER